MKNVLIIAGVIFFTQNFQTVAQERNYTEMFKKISPIEIQQFYHQVKQLEPGERISGTTGDGVYRFASYYEDELWILIYTSQSKMFQLSITNQGTVTGMCRYLANGEQIKGSVFGNFLKPWTLDDVLAKVFKLPL